MIIGYNLLSGIDSAAQEVIKSIIKIDHNNEHVLFRYNPKRKKIEAKVEAAPDLDNIYPIKRSWVYEEMVLPFLIAENNIDIFYCPNADLTYRQPSRTLATIDEFLPFLLKEKKPNGAEENIRLFLRTKAAKKANRLIVFSTFAKKLASYALDIKEDRIYRVIFPHEKEFRPVLGEEKIIGINNKYGIKRPYFICNAANAGSERLTELIEILNSLLAAKHDFSLVIEGLASVSGRNIMSVGKIDNHDLNLLYNGAIAQVSTAKFDTRCRDQLNALACGTPVIAYKNGALPEIIGNAGLMIENGDKRSFARAMKDSVENQNLRLKLKALGIQQSKSFSDEKAAFSLINIFQEIKNDKYRPDAKS